MDMSYLSGRSFLSDTKGYKDEEGNWNVVTVMTETLTYPNGTVREEKIEGSYKDPEFKVAHMLAMREVLQELQDLVYNRGFDSLIEAKDYDRSLEVDGDATIKFDAITPPEQHDSN